MIFRNFILENFPFLEDDFDGLTDYELFCKMIGYVKTLVKDNEDFSKRLTDLENYINNLDLQDEVNTKLDEMAQDGTLENLISQYIELMTTYTYNNVEEMKNATNLVNGSFARTSGFYSYNDGGGAYYKIRQVINTDVIDEMFIIALNDNNLVAELIYNDLNIKQIGARGNNQNDDGSILQYGINKLATKGGNLIIPKAIYLISNEITIPDNNELINIIGNNSTLIFTNTAGNAFNCKSTDNYIRITFKDLSIRYEGSGNEVNGINCEKVTERTLIDNVRIYGFYNNIMLKNCWNLTFNKLISTYATNDGIHCEDITNAFNFNSCIFTNNNRYNILLTGRGHVLNCCDISIYLQNSQNRFVGCDGLSINGCYYEEGNNPTNPIQFRQCRGISINGTYFEIASTSQNYRLIDLYNDFGISFNSCSFRCNATMDDTGYLIYIREGSSCNVNGCDFRNSNKVIYITNSQLSVDNNKLESVTNFITQDNHVYARITGNLQFDSDYTNCVLPHKEVAHLLINSIASYGNTASRPTGIYAGQTYFNTQTNHLDIYNGSSWLTA